MARIIENDKGFKVIGLNNNEARFLGFGISKGCICMHCNNIIQGEIYYIAALNDVMDKSCFYEWYKTAKYYPEDENYERRYFETYAKPLGLI